MRVAQLVIENFRGVRKAKVNFLDHTILVGPNGCGKSTVVEALALVLGRDRMVRALTEHDFFGSDPSPNSRIRVVVTLVGFRDNKPESNSEWFRDGRATPKWFEEKSGEVKPEPGDKMLLCAQVGFSARFDREELAVETVRYFHDDDSVTDPFDDESTVRVPAWLLSDVGFFFVPANRTWDRMISFGSELFKRIVTASGSVPSQVLIEERDRLRHPESPLEAEEGLNQILQDLNTDLASLFSYAPKVQMRLTSTDSQSLLDSIVPHYECPCGSSLPAGRHGAGLLSLQTILLLLRFGQFRVGQGADFILATEEPELHLPPGLQRRIMHRIESTASQTITTTHSPGVASLHPATKILVLENREGALGTQPLINRPLAKDAKNGIRKLLRENRYEVITALMHERVLVPEGRIDFEWLRHLTSCTESREGWDALGSDSQNPFGTVVGIIPTHDACVVDTIRLLSESRGGLVALVDGDKDGDSYIDALLRLETKPSVIFQWPKGWTIEDVVIWVLSAKDWDALKEVNETLETAHPSMEAFLLALKTETKNDGHKGDYLTYESLAGLIMEHSSSLLKARQLLDELCALARKPDSAVTLFVKSEKSLPSCPVLVWKA